jgi:uncharacterized membrane protein
VLCQLSAKPRGLQAQTLQQQKEQQQEQQAALLVVVVVAAVALLLPGRRLQLLVLQAGVHHRQIWVLSCK